MSSLWLIGRTFFFLCNSSVGPSQNGQEFGLIVDGDEMGLKLGEKCRPSKSGHCFGRLNLATSLRQRVEIFE